MPWLGSGGNEGTPLGLKIARLAGQEIGICENPPGSNRGEEIDQYNTEAGSPLASYWCANFVGYCYKRGNAFVPNAYGNCDNWLKFAKLTGTFSPLPEIGAAVLYGKSTDIKHIGIVVRLFPYLLVVEGNTTLDGFSSNGEIVAMKMPRQKPFGYVIPKLNES